MGPFDRIHCPDFPTVCDVTLREMNTDAQYLYKLCRAVIDGECLIGCNNIVICTIVPTQVDGGAA